ncbi:PREDICTED: uncharacterized protein LOC108745430 [Trachymyrmex septentrionalis]|uniref:uncharacterized protein LOC108745430 n=1 Tax=Trachymyrmex septentrionalis TaxID=34720 RepID=UPI00084F5088|nr:PREDICTED: uncharacterized protein LOC108745430 [Trachymyrmex septentrionalis]
MDRDAYRNKITELLGDSDTYVPIKRDPTKKLTTALRSMLTRWKTRGHIKDSEYRALYCSDCSLPRAYGLPKIHKLGFPLRIIVSSVGSPLYSLTTFLHNKLFKTIPRADSHVKKQFWTSREVEEQSFGTPMGSPISPVIAELVIRRLETVSLMSLNLDILFYYRYVDDICTALPSSQIDGLLERFNSFHPRLQFTVKRGGNTINFLDVTVSINKNRCNFDWYRKPTFLGRFLNFHSNHPLMQKKGIIFSLVDRAFLLSDYDRAFLLSDGMFHTKNLTSIINILLQNDYPLDFIFDSINQRIKNLIKKRHRVHNVVTDSDLTNESTSWLTVPFIPLHTEKFRTLNKNKSDIRVAFHSPNKMDKYIRVQKDTCPRTSKSNVVYKILCNNCDASYVEQTGRQLKTRIAEHRNHVRHKASAHSVITEHRLRHNHDFQWDNVLILDEEPSYRKRLISELLHIKRQKNSLNLQTEGLYKAYFPIINKV